VSQSTRVWRATGRSRHRAPRRHIGDTSCHYSGQPLGPLLAWHSTFTPSLITALGNWYRGRSGNERKVLHGPRTLSCQRDPTLPYGMIYCTVQYCTVLEDCAVAWPGHWQALCVSAPDHRQPDTALYSTVRRTIQYSIILYDAVQYSIQYRYTEMQTYTVLYSTV
jgi:hypothetical protein